MRTVNGGARAAGRSEDVPIMLLAALVALALVVTIGWAIVSGASVVPDGRLSWVSTPTVTARPAAAVGSTVVGGGLVASPARPALSEASA
jgi:hypothetical protein